MFVTQVLMSSSAKTQAQIELTDILIGSHSIENFSLTQNSRKKRQSAGDGLKLEATEVFTITAINEPLGSEYFLVTFE